MELRDEVKLLFLLFHILIGPKKTAQGLQQIIEVPWNIGDLILDSAYGILGTVLHANDILKSLGSVQENFSRVSKKQNCFF